jgi:hypothetical protein
MRWDATARRAVLATIFNLACGKPRDTLIALRLWTVHPRYLDAKGLVAAWREALLARKVLAGRTRGYTHHPQLARFRSHLQPVRAIATYLSSIAEEADRRGYNFDTSKIPRRRLHGRMTESRGQLLYEWEHLRAKLRRRSPEIYQQFEPVAVPDAHRLFRIIPGGVRDWERQPG